MNKRTVLELNSLWFPINLRNWRDTFTLICDEVCVAMDTDTFTLYDFDGWIKFSQDKLADPRFEVIKAVNFSVILPEVIVDVHYGKIPMKKMSFSRDNIYIRDNYQCQYCGKYTVTRDKKLLSLDHVVPQYLFKSIRKKIYTVEEVAEMSGKSVEFIHKLLEKSPTTWENVVTACKDCNGKKSHKVLSETRLKLKKAPIKPSWADQKMPVAIKSGQMKKGWEHFLLKNSETN